MNNGDDGIQKDTSTDEDLRWLYPKMRARGEPKEAEQAHSCRGMVGPLAYGEVISRDSDPLTDNLAIVSDSHPTPNRRCSDRDSNFYQ